MTAIKKIKALIKQGESATVEFKTSTAQLKSAFETVCAFLNNKGGAVLIGVNSKGELIGQDVTDNTRQEIAREVSKIEPHAEIDISYYAVDKNHKIIVIAVKSGKNAPYVYDDRPFLRNESTTIRMPREKYEQLLHDRKPTATAWEKSTTNDCKITDLAKNRIQQVVRTAVTEQRLSETAMRSDAKEILKKLDLMIDDRFTNAAVILFCKNERKQFIQSSLKLARFRGTDKREFIDNKVIRGNIFDLYEHAMTFLRSYLPIAGKIEEGNPFRVDTPAIPYKVLREAMVNALCHRDYSSPGGSISLAIYDDRVEVSSTGRLPNHISVKDLIRQHESHPRNPLIASVLYTCRMIEQWGRGTQDMVDFCKEAGNPKPKFVELTGSFGVVLPLKEFIGGYAKAEPTNLTARQREILKTLEKEQLTSIEIVQKLKDPSSRRTVQADLKKLEKIGKIKREGDSRATIWRLLQ